LYTDKELKEEDYAPFIYNKDQVGNAIKGIIFSLFSSVLFIYCIVILRKTNMEFYYHRVLKKWIYWFLTLLITSIIFIVLSLFDDFYTVNKFVNNELKFGLFIQEFLYFFVLFRPEFLDANQIKYSISDIMDLSLKKWLSEQINSFFKEKYYLQSDASVTKFAKLTKMTNDEINDFVLLKYHQNFIDLVNIHRIQHFILLINQGKHEKLTLESLSNLCGFSTRQALYLSFMKFKGCSPSDFISSLNS
jgi:AraC-like DNA-binding protein